MDQNNSSIPKLPAVEMARPAAAADVEKVADKPQYEGEVLDWLGRPATEKHGGSKTSLYILANQALWNMANFAVASNLVMYFKKMLQMSNATAANNVTNWTGTMWMFTLLGGFMGDSYWGRFWTCVVFQIVHILGLVGLSLSVTVSALKPAECAAAVAAANCPKVSTAQIAVFFLAIYTIALGSGGYLPAFTALGADQFDSAIQKTNFFGWLFFATNVGTILANTLFVWMENRGMWALSYWLATVLGALAFFTFGLGVPVYRQFRPAGNPFTRVAQVFVASLRKYRLKVPKDDSLLHEVDEKELIEHGCRKMPHTTRFRFLDKAATREGGDNKGGSVNGWRLCNVTQVEEVKQLWRMLPIFMMAIPFAAIFSQGTTLFVEEAAMMDTKLGAFDIPPAAMNVLNTMSIFVFTLLYPVLIVPIARRFTGKQEGMAPLQRMVVGNIISCLGMASAALLESRRLHFVAHGKQISILWQAPQQVIIGAAMVFVVVGAMDFFYSEAPHSMRGIVSSLSLTNLALGSYASSAIVSLTVHFTSRGGKVSWIPSDLNKGHLDYFFALLFILSIISTTLFVACVYWYYRVPPPRQPPPHNAHDPIMTDPSHYSLSLTSH